MGDGQVADIERMSTTISLKCPITMGKITLPARCQDCRHIQCFDLKAFLILNKDRLHWQCPLCGRPAILDNLEIDQYVWGILTNLVKFPEVGEVLIDSNASWKAHASIGREQQQSLGCNPPKRAKTSEANCSTDPSVCSWNMTSVRNYASTSNNNNPVAVTGLQVPIER
ncbi:MIZ/SP-RING zinc finger, partial [Trichinella nativa]